MIGIVNYYEVWLKDPVRLTARCIYRSNSRCKAEQCRIGWQAVMCGVEFVTVKTYAFCGEPSL